METPHPLDAGIRRFFDELIDLWTGGRISGDNLREAVERDADLLPDRQVAPAGWAVAEGAITDKELAGECGYEGDI